MLFLNFNKDNYNTLKSLMCQEKKIFLLVYTDSCKYCNDIIPEWDKLVSLQYIKTNDIIISKLKLSYGDTILNEFPRIKKSSLGVPKIIYLNGLKEIKIFTNEDKSYKNLLKWVINCLTLI